MLREFLLPRPPAEVHPCLCSLLPRGENLLSWLGWGRKLFPVQPGHGRAAVKHRQPMPTWGVGACIWLKQHTHTALPFVLAFCVFKRTCLWPHMLVFTLKRRVEPWNLYSLAYSLLCPGVESRLQCASADSRIVHGSKISSQRLESSGEILLLWEALIRQAIEKAPDMWVFRNRDLLWPDFCIFAKC